MDGKATLPKQPGAMYKSPSEEHPESRRRLARMEVLHKLIEHRGNRISAQLVLRRAD